MSTIIRPMRFFPARNVKNLFDIDSFFGRGFMDKLWDTASPAINISESEFEYNIDVAAPGFDKEDFSVDVNDNVLSITADTESETSDEDKEYSRKEYNFSSFSHSFRLPDNVLDNKINAEYKNGVLKITVPKSDKPVIAGKKIQIQ